MDLSKYLKYVDDVLKLEYVYYCVDTDELCIYRLNEFTQIVMTDFLIFGQSKTYLLLGPL